MLSEGKVPKLALKNDLFFCKLAKWISCQYFCQMGKGNFLQNILNLRAATLFSEGFCRLDAACCYSFYSCYSEDIKMQIDKTFNPIVNYLLNELVIEISGWSGNQIESLSCLLMIRPLQKLSTVWWKQQKN